MIFPYILKYALLRVAAPALEEVCNYLIILSVITFYKREDICDGYLTSFIFVVQTLYSYAHTSFMLRQDKNCSLSMGWFLF